MVGRVLEVWERNSEAVLVKAFLVEPFLSVQNGRIVE